MNHDHNTLDILEAGRIKRELETMGVFYRVELIETAHPYEYVVFAWRKTFIAQEGSGVEGYLYPNADMKIGVKKSRWNCAKNGHPGCSTSEYGPMVQKVLEDVLGQAHVKPNILKS